MCARRATLGSVCSHARTRRQELRGLFYSITLGWDIDSSAPLPLIDGLLTGRAWTEAIERIGEAGRAGRTAVAVKLVLASIFFIACVALYVVALTENSDLVGLW